MRAPLGFALVGAKILTAKPVSSVSQKKTFPTRGRLEGLDEGLGQPFGHGDEFFPAVVRQCIEGATEGHEVQ